MPDAAASFTDDVRTDAKPWVGSRHMRGAARGVVPAVIVAGLAVAGVAAIVVLQARTRSGLAAQARLGSFESAVHQVQAIPWELALAPRQAPSAALVSRQLSVAERDAYGSLSMLEMNSSSQALRGIRARLTENFAANGQIASLISHGKIDSTTPASNVATSTNDAVEGAVDGARRDYDERASASLTQGTLGSCVVIVLLVIGLLLVSRRLTKAREDRFRRTVAERASQSKSEFLSRVSHELRTPLNSILGFAQIIARSDLDDRQRANIERVKRAGRHLADLINEVLDISRIESGELRLSLEPLHLGTVLSEVTDLVSPLAEGHEVIVIADPSCAHAWVHADVQRIKQVLLNLIANAVKYNREGGHVTVTTEPAAEGRLAIVVSDDGPGIAPELIDRLFSPFERLGAESTTIEGTGLGLALCKGFVEAMGGSISAGSTPGSGSAFTVELAAAEPRPKPRRAPETPDAAPSVPGPRRKVLYIEDNVSNLDLVEAVFAERPELALLTAVQGTVGIALAQEHQPDVVLLDLNLPDVSGEVVLARIRANPTTADTPVIVLSADASEGQEAKLRARGAQAYLTKPIDVDALLHAIDDALLAVPQARA